MRKSWYKLKKVNRDDCEEERVEDVLATVVRFLHAYILCQIVLNFL